MLIIVRAFYYNSRETEQEMFAVCCHTKMQWPQIYFSWILHVISSLCTTYTNCICMHVQSWNNIFFSVFISPITWGFNELCFLQIFKVFPDNADVTDYSLNVNEWVLPFMLRNGYTFFFCYPQGLARYKDLWHT